MADPPSTPAATTTVAQTPEQVKTAAKVLAEETKEIFSKAYAGIGDLLTKSVTDSFKVFSSIGASAVDKFKEVSSAISKDQNLLNTFANSYTAFRAFTQTSDLFSGVSKSSESFEIASQKIKVMGNDWKQLTNLLTLGHGDGLTAAITNAGVFEQAENQMIGMLAAGGHLNTVFSEQDTVLGDLTTKTAKYIASLGDVAEANGRTLTSTIKWADAFNRIPGSMQENITVGGNVNKTMSALSASMKVLSGSGQTEADMQKVLSIAYHNVGNSMDRVIDGKGKGVALFAQMASLSKTLSLSFEETSGFLGDLAQQFKFVGDNTEAAARIMMRFTDGLRNTGLTGTASLEIIKQMTKSVSELSIGTKAYVSARSGGPGGLQGSIQIDKLNREGKSDQVMSMVLDTLKQSFGGRIVTQAEGATNQADASTFTRQKMMLQSGAFGNLVGTGPDADNKATRLLEMLAKGDLGGAAKTSKDAIGQVASQGDSLQKQTNTILNKMALTSERIAFATQITALNTLRSTGGSRSEMGKLMSENMDKAGIKTFDLSKRDLTSNVGSNDKGGGNDFKAIQNENNKAIFAGLGESKDAIVSLGSHMFDSTVETMQEAGKSVSSIQMKIKEEGKLKDIQKRTPDLPNPQVRKVNFTGNNDRTPTNLTKEQLTKGADQGAQRRVVFNATKNNAATQAKTENTVKVVLEGSDELKKLINIKNVSQESTKENNEVAKVVNNSPNGQPGY